MPEITDKLNDFPDRLSPMLVKELRQGMRAKTFVVVFLVLQGLLGLILLGASAGATSTRGGERVSEIVFVFFSLTVLVIQPLRGISALSGEVRGQTIDLMVLTRLSAMRITLGKWVALLSQSALLAMTIIPYLILRYYFGGMNLFAELMLVGMIFIISACFTAITVGLSACSSVLVRGILPLLAAILAVLAIFRAGFGNLSYIIELFTFTDPKDTWTLFLVCAGCIYLGWSTLSLGASLIAPHAENHATLRRLIALGLSLFLPLGMWLADGPSSMFTLLWFVVAAPAVATALSESEHLVPSVARSFVRRGPIGKLAGRLLYPGWPSGVVFTLALVAIGAVSVLTLDKVVPSEQLVHFLAWSGSLLLPGLLVAFGGARLKDRAASFILIWVAFFIMVMAIDGTLSGMSSRKIEWGFVWDPVILSMMAGRPAHTMQSLTTAGVIVDSIYGGLLLILALKAFRRLRVVEDEAHSA